MKWNLDYFPFRSNNKKYILRLKFYFRFFEKENQGHNLNFFSGMGVF